MATGYPGLNKPWHSRRTLSWSVLGSVAFHALLVAAVIVAFQEMPSPPKVVVPVEAVALVPFKTGPKGGGGGRPAPVSQPEAVAAKPALPPKPKPQTKHQRQPKARLAPPPEPTAAPAIPAPPAAAPAVGKTKPTATAVAGSRTGPSGVSGSGQGGQGGGRGTGSGGGAGSGQGPGSGAGSALSGYLREVRLLLEKHKDYPWMARRRNIQGVVALVFTIGSGGQIEASRISRPSGHDLLDEAARHTLRRVGKFPPFPPELNRHKLTIEVPLAFHLRKD